MKKILAGILAVGGILLTIAAVAILALATGGINQNASSVAIIGAADGPTSVFVAGTTGSGIGGLFESTGFLVALILAGILFVVAGVVLYVKGRK